MFLTEIKLLSVYLRSVGTDYKEFINKIEVFNPKFWLLAVSIEITYRYDKGI